jgi:PhoD related phosphatase
MTPRQVNFLISSSSANPIQDLERTYLIRTLQGIAHQKSLRMTFLSGGVDCCGAGLVHDPARPQDHKTMYQLISSSVVNAPPSAYIVKMLHGGSKAWYIPANGHRSSPNTPSDTKEDMMEIFTHEPDGRTREAKRLMGRRNYVALVAFDPDAVQGQFAGSPITAQQAHGSGQGSGKLSLAADFMVQVDGSQMGGMNTVSKYGPVIVPNLEFGR